MSKNFELMQNLGKEQELLSPTPVEGNATQVAASTESLPGSGSNSVVPGLEEIHALAQQVFLVPGADAPRTVVFTSTESASGCSWVCAHLGQVLAGRVGGSVCLVDANLYAPGLHQQFGVENQIGLSNALTQLDPIRGFVQPLNLPNLWLLSSGTAGTQGLASDRMRLRIAELRKEFDFVLIDTAAMSVSNDAISLGSFSDGVVMVLKANASRRETARQAIQDLQGGNAKVLGAVLNQRTFPIPDTIYKKF
jgi:succinoglycan biosynthesis transport protein ExoP